MEQLSRVVHQASAEGGKVKQMATNIKVESVTGPLGTFDVSTIRTHAGGGNDYRPPHSPFSDSDYVDETPWPFEVMVFRQGSSTGLYHAAFATDKEALDGHRLMVETIRIGTEFGGGVRGPFGVPSITPEEWLARTSRRAAK